MDVHQVSKECVELCFMEREDLVKKCMSKAFEHMRHGSNDDVPTDATIFSYVPRKERFVDYAAQIMRMETPTRVIVEVMMVSILEKFQRSSRTKRRITFDTDGEEEDENEDESPQGNLELDTIESRETSEALEAPRSKRSRAAKDSETVASPGKTRDFRRTRANRNTRRTRSTSNTSNPRDTINTRSTSRNRCTRNTRSSASEQETIPEDPVVDEDDIDTDIEEAGEDVFHESRSSVSSPSDNDQAVQEVQDTGVTNVSEVSEVSDVLEEENVQTPDPPVRPTLPVPLTHTHSGSMTAVSQHYFPDCEFVFPGIYTLPNTTGYALFYVDNGRFANTWSHHNDVTSVTWVTANGDKSRATLNSIADSNNVYVFRKISGESLFRYMGKVFKSDNVNMRVGTVDLYVC